MEGHARKCVERYWELAHKKVEQLYKVSSPCLDDHQFKQEELESVGELSQVCSQNVLKYLYLARIERPDILWSVNKLARAVTKEPQACDRRSARYISYVHHANDFRQYCHVGNTAQHCRLGLFQDSDFAGDLEDSESTSEGIRNYFVGCWIENGRTTCFGLVECGDRSVTFIEQYQSPKTKLQAGNCLRDPRKGSHVQTQTEGEPRR